MAPCFMYITHKIFSTVSTAIPYSLFSQPISSISTANTVAQEAYTVHHIFYKETLDLVSQDSYNDSTAIVDFKMSPVLNSTSGIVSNGSLGPLLRTGILVALHSSLPLML